MRVVIRKLHRARAHCEGTLTHFKISQHVEYPPSMTRLRNITEYARPRTKYPNNHESRSAISLVCSGLKKTKCEITVGVIALSSYRLHCVDKRGAVEKFRRAKDRARTLNGGGGYIHIFVFTYCKNKRMCSACRRSQ